MSAAQRGLIIFLIGLGVVLGVFVAGHWWNREPQNFVAAAIGGPFTLTDQNGVVRRGSDFHGKLMLIYFGYTYCPDACPAALTVMTSALDEVGEVATDVQPIFITVDPERDTVAQMKSYASNFDPRLLALTGSVAETTAAARAYRIYFEKVRPEGAGDYLVDHSSLTFLMGRDGKFLTYFGPEVTADQMAVAIKKYL
ncbi:MAG TPA: SCO family protein [Stellaceae bacterium]|nr:SCO family protein [Stellaceae bacterium]